MRPRYFVFLVLLAIGVFVIVMKRGGDAPRSDFELKAVQTLEKSSPSEPIQQETRQIEEPAPTPRPATSPSTNKPHVPPAGTIPFELKAGWVVAYGDVLIGKPKQENFPTRGYIDAPKVQLWPTREIAYSVHIDFQNPERVMRVIEYLNEHAPVRFVPLENQSDSLVFSPIDEDDACLSYLGRIGGHQPIFLGDRCQDREILHEVLHALGMAHEHCRPDRDQFITVNWDKIREDRQSQFELMPEDFWGPLLERPFDYRSIMHYPENAFAKEQGEMTLTSLSNQPIEPQRHLSAEDLIRLNLLYGNK